MRIAAVLATASLILAAAVPAGADDALRTHDTDLHEAIGSARSVDIDNLAGSITIAQSADNTVSVHARATSHRSDPSIVAVTIRRKGDALVVCAAFPGSSCPGAHRDSRDNENIDVEVDLTISVPAGDRVVANMVSGNVVATHLANDVRADVVNGRVRIATSGRAEAKTVNGSVDAILANPATIEGTKIETVNGAIHLTVPQSADASITARTVNGRLSSDAGGSFAQSSPGDHDLVGSSGTLTVGRGGARISLNTVSGSIRVSRS